MSMTDASSTTSLYRPHFRFLLHGKDGSIPYLTPELVRMMFCPEADAGSPPIDDDWKWRREHFILGVAVKDTCVTVAYCKAIPRKRKRRCDENVGDSKREEDGRMDNLKTKKREGPPLASSSSSSTCQSDANAPTSSQPPYKNDASDSSNIPREENNEFTYKMKPSGYTFLTQSRSQDVCTRITKYHVAEDRNEHSSSSTSNYLRSYLRIPHYISTIIVPTFSLDYPACIITTAGDSGRSHHNQVSVKKHDPKKPSPPLSSTQSTKKTEKQERQRRIGTIPNSAKDSMPIDTPHGWQKIQPEQFWDAVIGLSQPVVGSFTSNCTATSESTSHESGCEGAVGLFDHISLTLSTECAIKNGCNESSKDDTRAVLKSQSSSKNGKWNSIIRRVVQRTNEWTLRVQNYRDHVRKTSQQSFVQFWIPVHLAASQLPLNELLATPRSTRTNQETYELNIALCHNVAIVGWDAMSYNREIRRQGLYNLLTNIQSSPSPPKKYLVLSVSDLQSILDIVREGVSIIGTDLVREWSHSGKALCLDLTLDDETALADSSNCNVGGLMDMKDESYARDSSPILAGCRCLTCCPRRRACVSIYTNITFNDNSTCSNTKVPSFTRSYIHHLIKADEMLAETLLFLHNLHQMLLLFYQLSRVFSLDARNSNTTVNTKVTYLEAYCAKIERQLKSAGD